MSEKFKEYSELNLSQINKDILQQWIKNDTFNKSVSTREGHKSFVFFEGPPSANGLPGIHHVMARTIKDSVCRYKTMQGFQVHRKAGWDTHGLPVELGVEKELGITKEDIGTKISVEDYNNACRSNVMKYTSQWENLTQRIGYWVDMKDPYITYDNKYIETLWYLLKELYKKGLLYKGYTIQPYSPAAGTGLSSHELNQPGCYRDVKDTTCVGQFKVIRNEVSEWLYKDVDTDLFFLAWTTTPWTLSSNTALCVGEKITYLKVRTFNPYTGIPCTVVLAKERLSAYFNEKGKDADFNAYNVGDKIVPFTILDEFTGKQLLGIQYEQLLPWVKIRGNAFKVISGDYVTTEDGTGIVHIAPTFGADDAFVAKKQNIAGCLVIDKNGNESPLVDKQGRMFLIENMDADYVKNYVNVDIYKEYSGRYVKNAFDDTLGEDAPTLDIDLCVELKKDNKTFKVEKHVHNYPHCWRTDKPIIYYPLDSWFIKTPQLKERMMELNNTINWKPASTGSGRFGKWLENLNDWNLSRSRYWGTPLPIWMTEDKSEEKCIGSLEELKNEIELSIKAGFMKENPLKDFVVGDFSKENYNKFDIHRPYVDNIILVSPKGQKMYRETDIIDVWFDSGSMPYAQIHYPFENKENFKNVFPADFIAEGVDQTRGWFFTLHAIATMLFDSVAFKNVISNGLVLDKNGNKMSKRLGNAVDPFQEIEKQGTDPVRWYMITNSSPWDNLKYDSEGVDEVKRKFFGTLYNTYSFFALYANLDNFAMQQAPVPNEQRPEIDRWILSLLNTLIKNVTEQYENLEPTKAGRLIQDFVIDNLSNWYVRLSRKRFWKGELNTDKISAYQTLYTCLETVSLLMAPIAPFYADQLFCDLNKVTKRFDVDSVHLATFPKADESVINSTLETRMGMAQTVSSMILALRRKVSIKVRQPLQKIIIPILNDEFEQNLKAVEPIIKAEVNVKEIDLLKDASQVLVKTIKPNFKALGPKCGKIMKDVAATISAFSNEEICEFENNGAKTIVVNGQTIDLTLDDVTIISKDIPGWQVANEGHITVALDTTLTDELVNEGIAREFVNRIQNLRKDSGFDVTDKIKLQIQKHNAINKAIEIHKSYIASETLCTDIQLVDEITFDNKKPVEIDADIQTNMAVQKV
ncbi:MAG: isoleucine--tRNA ligase [Bacteroidales bacterium]|nr:isoleucine--tRNA ligase [Bacteroidales bacterium]